MNCSILKKNYSDKYYELTNLNFIFIFSKMKYCLESLILKDLNICN